MASSNLQNADSLQTRCVVCHSKPQKCKFSLAMNDVVYHICCKNCMTSFRNSPETYINSNFEEDESQCELCGNVTTNSQRWQFMDFCSVACLRSYQEKCTAVQCFLCGTTASDTDDLDKLIISFRAGESLSDRLFCRFCSQICLKTFCTQSLNCQNCSKLIQISSGDVYADIIDDGGESGSLSYFCSYECLRSSRVLPDNTDITHRRLERSMDVVVKQKAQCSICGKHDFPHHEVNVQEIIHSLCSDECFDVFRSKNVSSSVHMCDQCSTLCDSSDTSNSISAHFSSRDHFFCDEQCLILFKATNRSFSYCRRCSSKRGKYGILYLNFGDSKMLLFCSPECLILQWKDRESESLPINVQCNNCNYKMTTPAYCCTNSIGTVKLFCSQNCFDDYENKGFYEKHLKKFRIDRTEGRVKCVNIDRENYEFLHNYAVRRSHQQTTDIDESSTPSNSDFSHEDSSLEFDNRRDSIKTKRSFSTSEMGISCRPQMEEKSVTALPIVETVECQTDGVVDSEMRRIITLPLPYLCPLPLAQYKAPIPTPHLLPVPIPFPVPLKLPTHQNVKDFNDRIKEAADRIPQDPYENSIISMSALLSLSSSLATVPAKLPDPSPPPQTNIINTFKPQMPEIVVDDKLPLDDGWNFKFSYGVKAWNFWISNVSAEDRITINRRGELINLTSQELAELLCHFLQQVRKINGEQYTPDSLYYLCLGIQAYLYVKKRSEDIFSGFGDFRQFTDRLDAVLSSWKPRVNEAGLLLCRVEEEHLWECKQLGSYSAYILLNTLVYFNTKYFLLKTAEEHYNLLSSSVVKQSRRSSLHSTGDGRAYFLKYCNSFRSMFNSDASYEQPENCDNHMRCPVRLYEFYLMKCPESLRARQGSFYLCPESCVLPDSPYWFSGDALPINEIRKMLNRIFIVKEIQEAYITNHHSY